MTVLHNFLIQKYSQYRDWHQTKHCNKIHWGVLILYTLFVFSLIINPFRFDTNNKLNTSSTKAQTTLEIPLTIEEPAGIARTNEPVTSGIPLPQGTIVNTQEWSLWDGAIELPLQVTRLSGRTPWILLDFQVSLNANQKKTLTLKQIPSTTLSSHPLTITEDTNQITISNNIIKTTLSKTNFNLLEEVWLDKNNNQSFDQGEQIITPQPDNIQIIDSTTKQTFSGKGTPTNISWEYQGPLRSTLRVDGRYTNGATEFIAYTTRLTFYAGRSDLKIEHILRNSYQPNERHVKVKSATLKVGIGSASQRVTGYNSLYWASVDSGGITFDFVPSVMGISYVGDNLNVDDNGGWLIPDLTHGSKTVVMDFREGLSVAQKDSRLKITRSPLLAIAPGSWYSEHAELSTTKFSTLDDEKQAYQKWGWTYTQGQVPWDPHKPDRMSGWADVHGDTESDDTWQNLIMYLRTGSRGYWDRTTAWASYYRDRYPYRTDNFPFAWSSSWESPKVNRPSITIPLTSNDQAYLNNDVNPGKIDLHSFGADHLWGWGLIDYYYLTGDVEAINAAKDLGEVTQRIFDRQQPGTYRITGSLRQAARHFLLLTRLSEVTQDPQWQSSMDHMADLFIQSPDWDARGIYVWPRSGKEKSSSSIHLAAASHVLSRYYQLTGKEPVRQRLIQMADFAKQYALHPSYLHTSYWFAIDYPNPGDVWYSGFDEGSNTVAQGYTAAWIDTLVHAYRLTNDITYLDRAKFHWDRASKAIYGQPYNIRSAGDNEVGQFINDRFLGGGGIGGGGGAYYLENGHLPYAHLLFYEYSHLGSIPDSIPPSTPTNLTTTTVSSSQINLFWTASTDNVGVTGYKIYRNSAQIATTTNTSYSDTGLSPSTTYLYLVSAYDATGNTSNQSVSASATTLEGGGEKVIVAAVNAGGSQYTALDNIFYQTDGLFTGGNTYTITATIAGTADVPLYQSQRYGNFSYNIPLTNGSYMVTLKFAELYWSTIGQRIFDVLIEGNEVISNLDVFAKVGKNVAYDMTIPVTVADSALTIAFRSDVDLAIVNAIKVIAGTPSPPDTTPPTTPTNFTATAISSSQINLSWTASTDNAGVTGYKIHRNSAQIATTTNTGYSDTGLSPSTTYTYTVAAYDATGNTSPQSASANATTRPSTGINPILVNLADNTWVKLNPTPTQRIPCGGFVCDSSQKKTMSNPVGRSYSGIAYGDGKIFYWGGGHGSHPGNDVEIYDIARNIWEQQFEPEGLPSCCLSSSCSTDINDNVCVPIMGGSSSGYLTPSGKPYTRHQYQQQVYDPIQKKFILGALGPWSFDADTKEFIQLTAYLPPSTDVHTKMMTYDPGLGTILWFATTPYWMDDRGVFKFDYNNNTWVKIGTIPDASLSWDEFYSAYDATQHKHLISHGNASWWWYDSLANTWTKITNNPSDLPWASSFVYDSANKVFIIATGQSDGTIGLWSFDGQSQWVKLSPLGLPPQGNAPWGVLVYDSIHQVLILVNPRSVGGGGTGGINEGDVETWAYRYKKASSVPDTQAPTNPTNLSATTVSSSQINLSWNASADDVGVTGYKIYRCAGSACAPTVQIVTSATNSYSNTDLTASTAYTYAVSAYDAAGNESGKSGSASATTLSQFKPSDLNQDRKVDQLDFDILKQDWNRTDKPVSDLNQDGVVDSRDLGIMMSEWTR